ncbi:MAG: PQQ-dependent sugar dehydrogenase [Myxococcota bacterium]
MRIGWGRRTLSIAAVVGLTVSGCVARIGDADPAQGPDAGETSDSGAFEDAGMTADVGVASDSGADSGMGVDAGAETDAGASTDAGPPDSGVVLRGLDVRPENTTCVAPPRPGGVGLTKGTLLPTRATQQMTDLRRVPSPFGGWLLIERLGTLDYIDDAGTVRGLLDRSDLTGLTTAASEYGLLGLAIDPLYPNAEAPNEVRIFLNYTGDCVPCKTIVSRFVLTRTPEGSFNVSDEEILLRVRQPAANHNGGALAFGPDRLLYISFGDGGSGNDPWCSGQNPWSPLGKIFRIDVHSQPTGYSVPVDNPWYADPQTQTPYPKCNNHIDGPPPLASPASDTLPDESRNQPCPETIATGLRNPFRMSFDFVEGHLWIGDVGQGRYEEVDHFAPSAWTNGSKPINFGWPFFEAVGDNSGRTDRSAACQRLETLNLIDRDFAPATYYYDRGAGGGRSVAGGVVYRGSALGRAYYGRYLFADVLSGNVWFRDDAYTAEEVDVSGEQEQDLAFSFPYGFVEDEQNEIVALVGDPADRAIRPATPGTPLPTLLSQTGCVDPSDPSQPASGLIPYGVEVPLWSDGAVKTRYLALPEGTQIGVMDDGDLDLPIGAVAVKVFRTPANRLLETRLMVRHDDGGWAGYTYVWRDDQSEADLAISEVAVDAVDWVAPSRSQCLTCHTTAAGGSLGLELAQLNGPLLYPSTGRMANQLTTWNHLELFADGPVDPAVWPALSTDPVRGYLHSNCANCHRPGTPVPTTMDLRVSTPLTDMRLCDERPTRIEDPNLRLLAPGAPERSLLSLRLRDLGTGRMPPLASRVIDEASVDTIDDWIRALSGCP